MSKKERDGFRAWALEDIVKKFEGPKSELDFDTPFQFLVAVMLSAQTTDKQVNRVTPEYFSKVASPEDALRFSPEETFDMLRGVNYDRTKAKHVREAAKMLVDAHGGKVPNDLESLMALPGVGIKTAKVVLGVLYDQPFVGVDTHVHRVLNRLGIVDAKSPEETDRMVERDFTEEEKMKAHHPLVLF